MKKSRVLYIDDEVELLDLAVCFFEDEGIELDTCSDFHEAFKLVKERNYDMVISDAKMPSGSGTEFLRIIKHELSFKGKIILVTGNLQEAHVEKELGHDLILYKPIEFHDFVRKVKKLLGHL